MGKRQRSKGSGCVFKRTARGPYIARWFDFSGKRRQKTTGTTDRTAAERMLAKHVADSALRRDGVVDPRADRYAKAGRRPVGEHVEEWLADLTAKGVTAKHVRAYRKRVSAMIDAAGVESVSGLSAVAVQAALADLHRGGLSLQTCQHYLQAVKQFSRWLTRNGRTRVDDLVTLTRLKVATDRRYERRALSGGELTRLINTTQGAGAWRGVSGAERAMIYRVAAGTGFRANELRSLTPAAFRLDDDPPTVTVRATASKRRRADVQPIRSDLGEVLARWLDGKASDVAAFNVPEKTAEMLQADLRRARARWIRETPDRRERRERRQSDFLAVVEIGRAHV